MAKKAVNTNFRLGLNRQELIEAAQIFGKAEKTAKKDSTKRLEQYITNQLSGVKGTKVPVISDRAKKDISEWAKDFSIHEAVHSVSHQIKKLTGKQDESNYLRLTVARAFRAFSPNGNVSNTDIDVLISRFGDGNKNEIISGLSGGENSYFYQLIMEDYADELREESEQENERNIDKANKQFKNK